MIPGNSVEQASVLYVESLGLLLLLGLWWLWTYWTCDYTWECSSGCCAMNVFVWSSTPKASVKHPPPFTHEDCPASLSALPVAAIGSWRNGGNHFVGVRCDNLLNGVETCWDATWDSTKRIMSLASAVYAFIGSNHQVWPSGLTIRSNHRV